jgi:serine/threonine protein kinase
LGVVRSPIPFGKYLLLDRLSIGGMAEVYRAKSMGPEGFEKIIAIKRILPSMGEDKDFVKMFIDEAKIAGQLSHGNICQIFELGIADGAHFIAMEYVWGKDLLQIQNRYQKLGKRMPVEMACYVISRVCEGLQYAHRKKDPLGRPLDIVHRDCSPQNLLVSYDGEVKVIDFGIARAATRSSRTNAGVLKGKFGYMSPEQVRGLPIDRRSDIFAIGTVLYESLTGERLFLGESDFSTLERVRNGDISSPKKHLPDLPDAVEAIVMKALKRDPDDRYQWCGEMNADLRKYLSAQKTPFTAKLLGDALKETFATELERERELIEEYKRLDPKKAQTGEHNGLMKTQHMPFIAVTTPRPDPASAETEQEDAPTAVFGEISPERLASIKQAMAERRQEPAPDPASFEGMGMSMQSSPAQSPPPPQTGLPLPGVTQPARPTMYQWGIPGTPSILVPPAMAQTTVATPAPDGDTPISPMPAMAAWPQAPQPAFVPPVAVEQPPPTYVGRGLRGKDIAISVGIATLVVLLFFAGKKMAGANGAAPVTEVPAVVETGTIMIAVDDVAPAEVTVNDELVGA